MGTWQSFEEHVQTIYGLLLNMHDDGIMVARDVRLRGRDGQEHQIDVYYEFEKAGVRHRVAIECKCWSSPVTIKEIKVLKATVDDILGLRGVMVSAQGYQAGARKFAEDNGIEALELADLPKLGHLLAERLRVVALPDETTVGQPFWTLYELADGVNTGSPYSERHGDTRFGLLFYSKKQAQQFRVQRTNAALWGVRGLPQSCLRSYILTLDACDGRFMLVLEQPEGGWIGNEIPRSELIEEFYVASNPIPDQLLVMPSAKAQDR